MTIDWKVEAARLSKYWWGPHAPGDYKYKDGDTWRGAGVLVIRQSLQQEPEPDYRLAWNLMLLEWGQFGVPDRPAWHAAMVSLLATALPLAQRNIEGHPLGTYTWLMSPGQFADWVVSKPAFAVFGAEPTRRWAGLAKNLELAAA